MAKEYSKEELNAMIKAVQEYAKEHGSAPPAYAFFPNLKFSDGKVRAAFGSVQNFLREAGVVSKRDKNKLRIDIVHREFKEHIDKHGTMPPQNAAQYSKCFSFSISRAADCVRRTYDLTLNEYIVQAFGIKTLMFLTRRDCEQAFEYYVKENNKDPKNAKDIEIKAEQINNLFGSWKEFIKHCNERIR